MPNDGSDTEDYVPTAEPNVPVPMPSHGGAPSCPACGYVCGCCCPHECQTPCPAPDSYGDCDCGKTCHGGHEPWDCHAWSTRYDWARAKSETLHNQQAGTAGVDHAE